MGYRTLLKRYIQHVELAVGENFIETDVHESELTVRDVGELSTLASELRRSERATRVSETRNPNQRLRLLMSRYALDTTELCSICGIPDGQLRRWRASPRSMQYEALSEDQLSSLEAGINRWLESLGRRH
jgi:hypothetical protein